MSKNNYVTVKNSKGETLTIVISEEVINKYLENGINKIVIDNTDNKYSFNQIDD